ncbi:hypothetical protein [Reticulibacter mediterranei]|uniref:hypothetical protein n=1 Tax=Reticulibacter mediterranei TaxID=2778369 RepID=UPI001C688DDD|nr:hypothetical protein [Reticulibacter mediterranei]
MSNAEPTGLSSSPLKGVQGLPAGVWGVPSFLPSFARRLRRRAKEKKKGFLRGHPAPRQRAAALCTPARWENWKALAEPIAP